MFRFTPRFDYHNQKASPLLLGASATQQSNLLNHILDCFAPLAMTILAMILVCFSLPAFAATSIPFTINMSKAVNVTGTPRIAVDVGGVTRYATYTSGTGTSALTFTYTMIAGDADLDGVTVSSPIDLNGGTIKDLAGNNLSPLTFTPPNTSNVKVNYPSLGMDFVYDADGRFTLNGTVYNDLTSFLSATGGTFTRASVGTYFDSTGTLQTALANVPRFDYDPITNAAKGILIEESRTNLIPNGQAIGASGSNLPTGWSVDQAFGGISPSSTSSTTNTKGYGAFQFTINGTTGYGNRLLIRPLYWPYTDIAVSPNTAYTMTWGAELMGGSYPYGIQINFMWFDSSGTYLSSTLGTNRASISGFTRYADTTTSPANAAILKIRFDFTGYGTAGTNVNFTMQLSGVQLEQGAFPTSYIPTTTAAVTRAADTLTLPTSLWFNGAEGTLLGRAATIADATFISTQRQQLMNFSDGGLARLTMRMNNSGNSNCTIGNGSVNNDLGLGVVTQNVYKKMGCAYNATGSASSYNGSSPTSAIGYAGTLYSPITIGSSSTNLNGYITSLKYYPLKVSNTQLQLLTQ